MVFERILNQSYAIDAGSSHVVLAAQGGTEVLREPCVIALAPRKFPPGRRKPPPGSAFRLHSVGRDVRQIPPGEERGLRLVYPIDHGRIADLDGLELVLHKVVEQARMHPLRKALFGMRMTMLTPLHLDARERQRFQELLRDFGFNRIRELEAPVAAARGAGIDTWEARGQMLVDIGGGQTTIVAFTMGNIAAWHWTPTGGRALDAAIVALVLRRHRLALPVSLAESVKWSLGSVYPRTRAETLEISGFDTATGIEKKVTLDDNELRDALIDACEPLVMAIHQSFDEIPPELAADISHGAITLVGGGALLDGLPDFLAERTGLNFRLGPDPINVAIRGALADA